MLIKYITQENITLIISILSFFISSYLLLIKIITDRTNLDIKYIYSFQVTTGDDKNLHVKIKFTNKSNLPISITNAYLIIDDKEYEFEYMKSLIYKNNYYHKSEISNENSYYNAIFPVNLSSFSSFSDIFTIKFKNNETIPYKQILKIKLITSRKNKIFDINLNNNKTFDEIFINSIE